MTELEVTGRLQDGTRIVFRPLRPSDKTKLVAGLAELSDESRFDRFFTSNVSLDDKRLRYLTEVDLSNHFAWGAGLPDVEGEPGIGVGRWIRSTTNPKTAEAAVVVVDAYQGMGIGRALMWLLVGSAVEQGIEAFTADVLGSNRRLVGLMADLGAQSVREYEGVRELVLPLPRTLAEFETYPRPSLLLDPR